MSTHASLDSVANELSSRRTYMSFQLWVAAVNCTDLADENCTLGQAGGSVGDGGAAHVRTGATSAVASLSGAGAE
jgi:hypothetical protein